MKFRRANQCVLLLNTNLQPKIAFGLLRFHYRKNQSLQAINDQQSKIKIFEVTDVHDIFRAQKIAEEFNINYIFKGAGNEYQRIAELKKINPIIIIGLNFPKIYDVEDYFDAGNISLTELKNWELAPSNPAALAQANIKFLLSTSDLKKPSEFLNNLRKAVKYGLSESFTLDLMLIPDFGQVVSDNVVLNLTPYEVQFQENRPFFTEGASLFNGGGSRFFYSRRIGGTPINYWSAGDNLNANEELISNPSESKLLNASKISGRTEHGLGIGILNAVTRASTAVVRDTLTGETRNVETDPVTNYNVFVLNKSLKNSRTA